MVCSPLWWESTRLALPNDWYFDTHAGYDDRLSFRLTVCRHSCRTTKKRLKNETGAMQGWQATWCGKSEKSVNRWTTRLLINVQSDKYDCVVIKLHYFYFCAYPSGSRCEPGTEHSQLSRASWWLSVMLMRQDCVIRKSPWVSGTRRPAVVYIAGHWMIQTLPYQTGMGRPLLVLMELALFIADLWRLTANAWPTSFGILVHPSGCPIRTIKTVKSIQCESKNPPWGVLTFFIFFINGREFLIDFLHAYYRFPSTLGYRFLFNYLRFWRSYAILSANTQFT